ncbi:hypothetical protein RDWZM_001896 [Blomia tropicalis]|uniref:Glomulin n=1 Tax=Blomia tropicalis TaxID=40697 RepID=A0A9Q0MCH8_BLOTA|nr:hypothetical protein BLOT_007888 [Blomia tropicalis]KAJ6223351.1 hypothetical protein RDWZM_001896 [Blomia tropicalis]
MAEQVASDDKELADDVLPLPIGNMSTEYSKMEILKNLQVELEKHRMREVNEVFHNSVLADIRENGSCIIWDLVPIICQRLRGLSEFRFKTFNYCRQMLIHLTEVCNPKELLIIYLSELEKDLNLARCSKKDTNGSVQDENNDPNETIANGTNHDDTDDYEDVGDYEITDSNCFKALLKPLELILQKLPKKRNETLKSVLNSLNDHVSRLSLSAIENYDFDTDDRSKLMSDPGVKNLNSVLSMYVNFLETFVQEVDISQGDENYLFTATSVPNIQRMILLKSLLRILDYPLKHMDLFNLDGENKSKDKDTRLMNHDNGLIMPCILNDECISSRSIAIKVTKLISSLHSSFFTLLNRTDLLTTDDSSNNYDSSDIHLSPESFCSAMSVICYLLSTEGEMYSSIFFPRVYTHVYKFGVHLPYVRHLLDNNQFLIYDKGLELLKSLLDHIKVESLEVNFLDLLRQMPIEKSLISIMVFSPNKASRALALSLFRNLVYCFEPIGRYKILYSILSQPRQHSGFHGIIISMYKDLLTSNAIFQGTNLHRVVRSIINISLPCGANSDLLEKNDCIFGALNFFRYIFINDPRSVNKTRIWDILPVISETFLTPLAKALDLSRTHYKVELTKLKALKLNKMHQMANKKDNVVELTVLENKEHLKLPELTIEQEHNVIILALQNFELLESVLARLKEIAVEQAKVTTTNAGKPK